MYKALYEEQKFIIKGEKKLYSGGGGGDGRAKGQRSYHCDVAGASESGSLRLPAPKKKYSLLRGPHIFYALALANILFGSSEHSGTSKQVS